MQDMDKRVEKIWVYLNTGICEVFLYFIIFVHYLLGILYFSFMFLARV